MGSVVTTKALILMFRMILYVFAGIGIWYLYLQSQWDRCLDEGGRWLHSVSECDKGAG